MKEIAIIMPVYKAHDTIKNTLMSIGMQRHASYKLYMVVDGEPEGEYDYLKGYCDIDMEIYYMKENAGPGVARQFGIDFSIEPFISFIDADDTYLSSLALFYQMVPFTGKMDKDHDPDKTIMVSTSFLQENKDHTIRLRERDMVWMHGKIYRRAYLDKYDIRFNETRANEDVGFNTQCQCFANEDEQVYLSHDVTYMWQWRDNSTVRTDNNAYAFNESIDGFVENKIYALKRVIERNGMDDSIRYFTLKPMAHLFKKYLAAMLKAPKQMKHVLKWSRKYYKTMYPLIGDEYIAKADKTILAQSGLNKVEHYDEYIKWLDLLAHGKKRKR
jgi:glycosyltransferase involved in cell wall biosynthesis